MDKHTMKAERAAALAEEKLKEIGALLGATTEAAARRLAQGVLRVVILTSRGEVRSLKTVIGGGAMVEQQFLLLHLSPLHRTFSLLEWKHGDTRPSAVPLSADDEDKLTSFIQMLSNQRHLVDPSRLLLLDELRLLSTGGQLRAFEHPAVETPSPATSLPGTPTRETQPVHPSSPPLSQREIASMDGLEKTDEVDPVTGFNVYKDKTPTPAELEKRRRMEEQSEDVQEELAANRGEPRLERIEPDGTIMVDTPLEKEAAVAARLEKKDEATKPQVPSEEEAADDFKPIFESISDEAHAAFEKRRAEQEKEEGLRRKEEEEEKRKEETGGVKSDGGRKRAHDGIDSSDLPAPPCKRCREIEAQCQSLRKEKDQLEQRCMEQQETVNEARSARNEALGMLEKEKGERRKILLAAAAIPSVPLPAVQPPPPAVPQQQTVGANAMQAQARAAVAASRRVEIPRDNDTVSAFTLRSAGSPLKEGRVPMVAIEEEEEDMDLQEGDAPAAAAAEDGDEEMDGPMQLAAGEEPSTRETTPVPLRVSLADFQRNTMDTVQFLRFLQNWMLFEAPFCSVPSLPRYSGGSGRPLAPDQPRSSVLPTSRSWHTRVAKAVAQLIDDLRRQSADVLESGVCTRAQQRRLEKLFWKLKKTLRLAEKVHRTALTQIQYSDERVRQQNKPRFSASEQMDGRLEKIKRRARKIFNLLKETD